MSPVHWSTSTACSSKSSKATEDVVRNLMSNIARDTTHRSVKVFYEAEVSVRAFESWNMAYLAPTPQQLSTWAGLPAAATVDDLLANVNRDPDRVPRIVKSVLNALVE